MINLTKPIALLFLVQALTASLPAFALTPAAGETLLLTVVNHSAHTLRYKNTAHAKATQFKLTSCEILPGASITVQATAASHWSGIFGDLVFEDKGGHKDILQIRDPLQIAMRHETESFSLRSPHLISFIPSRTLNTDSQPYSLAWTKATVNIQDRLGAHG